MKNLIVAVIMMAGVAMSAQHRGEKREHFKPEQRAELKAKEMTLALNLNEKQQKDVKALLLDRSKKAEAAMAQRKAAKDAGKKPTADERFAMKSKMLDEQIAMKAEMKKILSAEQFDKWEKHMQHKKMQHSKKREHFRNKRK